MFDFAQAISETYLSQWIQTTTWVVPMIQTVHILAMAIVVSSIFMIDMRILDLAGGTQTMTQTARRFVPWVWGGLGVMAASGALLIVGEPVRSLVNQAFWIKMGLLAIALAATVVFQISLRGDRAVWERTGSGRAAARALAVATLLVWVGVIVAGRWIAYAFVPPQ